MVEHLPPETIPVLMEQIARVLRPGGVAVLETPNPASFATHVQSFWRDPTHIRPVPDAALAFEKAHALKPDEPNYAFNLALAFYALGDGASATREAEALVARHPEYGEGRALRRLPSQR